MGTLTDAQLDHYLNLWAKWCHGDQAIAALGYPQYSIDQSFIQSNQTQHTVILNHDIESLIEKTVSALSIKDRLLADVGRREYGADRLSHDPEYDKPNQERNAQSLGMSKSTYKVKLSAFRLVVWSALTVLK